MWPKRPDPELVGGWIDRAIELSEPESASRSRALIARSYWERKDPEVAREASELADRLGDLDLRSYAWGARATVDFAAGDFERSMIWSQRRLDVLSDISDPDHVANIYEEAIPTCCAVARLQEARQLAATHYDVVEPLSDHHRVHGMAVLLEVEETCGGWERILELASQTEAAVEANLATPCIRNARSLLVTALAAAHAGDEEAARRYERRADEVATEGYDFVLAAPRTWLALQRGEVDDADALIAQLDLSRGQTWFALQAAAARLDALATARECVAAEREALPLLLPGTYLEPFALRALGIVRQDEALIQQASDRFRAMGLTWHAEQSGRMLAARRQPRRPGP